MTIAAGPFAIAAALLVLAGVSKVARPHDTARALDGVGARVPSWLVRIGAFAELVIGAYALLAGDRLAAVLVVASYAAFTAFVVTALVRDLPLATCGCFGRTDTPPSLVHVGVNVAAIAAAVVVAVEPGVGIADVVADQPLAGVPYVLLVSTGVLCSIVALSTLPRTLLLARQSSTA